MPALVPAAAIVALAEGGRMTVDEAREALSEIELSIRRTPTRRRWKIWRRFKGQGMASNE